MADIILSPALQVIFEKIASPVLQRLGEVWDFKDNLKKLQKSLLMVQAVLEDAEEQQLTRKAAKIWLSKLRDAVYDAEDLLEHLAAKGIANYLPMSTNADKLRKTLEDLETTAIEGLSLNLREGSAFDGRYDGRETGSFIIESEVYGREEDREKIVQLLLSCEATQDGHPVLIPVIGIGGIGKTTLVQLAYNDELVTQSFDVKIWVFVSKNFDVKTIMKTVIGSATKKRCKFTKMDVLQSELWGLLHRKRYLIVLDDVWSEDQLEWEKLRPLFRGGLVGSKIILTTRSKKVAMIMDCPTFPYNLKGLDEADCWALFRQRAFQRGEECRYPYLLPIGKQIVRKCGGLPLAAKTLGSLMRFKREEREWLSVANSELWSLEECPGGILPSLMLSYYHLPSHLKRCFAFCSIFPKNFEIEKEKLIHLWMAEGLILHEGNKALEDIGNQYFNDFLWMSFFQDVEKSDSENMTRYKMHDVIHDLARYVAGIEFVMLDHYLLPSSLSQTRHSSIICKFGAFTIPEALCEAEHLRTLVLISGGDLQEVPRKLLLHFKYLRVLDLNSCGLTKLHESIGRLFCLRYLDLSYTFIKSLPSAIRSLHSLQTLNMRGCCNLERLPDLSRMAHLRHLILTGCDALTSIPFNIEELPQLQTLPMFIVDGYYNGIQHLEHVNLHGELKIKHLQNVWNAHVASSANLRKKENLELLGLHWEERDNREECNDNLMPILEALQPHQNVKQLVIEGYPGTRLPNWMLPNLTVVILTNCRKCERLPSLGNLTLLKTLSLCGMDGLKCIGPEFYGEQIHRPFPSLEELSLRGFPNLKEWSTANDGDAFSKLRKLIVDNCPKLINMPRFPSLQNLELRNCNQAILSIANFTSLLTLSIERIPQIHSISGSFLAGNTFLTSLEIISCPKLRLIPLELGSLTALKSLTIRWCEELMSLPQSLQNLNALESLEISECHSMTSLPDNGLQGLSSLRTLSIENCNSLTSVSLSLHHLTSLEHLTIMYCPSLGSLPDGLLHLFALRSLTILSCPQLLSLPEELKYVTTLHFLEIHSCPGLTSVPEWVENLASLRSLRISDCRNIKHLPESLKQLTALQHLSIQDCPELEERSKQESGQDWPKISHIPHKHIGTSRFMKSTVRSSSTSSAESSSSRARHSSRHRM